MARLDSDALRPADGGSGQTVLPDASHPGGAAGGGAGSPSVSTTNAAMTGFEFWAPLLKGQEGEKSMPADKESGR